MDEHNDGHEMKQPSTKQKIIARIILCVVMLVLYFFFRSVYAGEVTMTSRRTQASSVTLFVSLGMPDNTLKAYLKQAKHYHIPVVLRGLYTVKNNTKADKVIGSFRDTASRVFNLLKNQSKDEHQINGGVSINPILYRQFKITSVPALVVGNSPDNFDVLYGNVPIYKALRLVSEKSKSLSRAGIAQQKLDLFGPRVLDETNGLNQ